MKYDGLRMRTGRSLGRTLYWQMGARPSGNDPVIGMVDKVEIAEEIVRRWNAEQDRRDLDAAWQADLCPCGHRRWEHQGGSGGCTADQHHCGCSAYGSGR